MKSATIITSIRALQAFQLLRFAGFFLTGILLAKSAAPTSLIGIYETLMFVSAATGFFWVSGILNSLLATYSRSPEDKRGNLLLHAFFLLSILNVILIVLLKLFESNILELTGPAIRPYYNYLLVFMLFNNPAFLAEYVLLLRDRTRALLGYGIIVFGVSLVVTAMPFYYGSGLMQSMQLLIILSILKFFYTLSLLFVRGKLTLEFTGIKDQLLIAAPLISGLLVSGSAEYIDGFLVTHFFGAESFAIFRYGAREFPLTLLMANALSMAMVPVIAAEPATGIPALRKEAGKLMHYFFIPVCLLMLFSEKIYPLIFRPEFVESAGIFNIYLLLLISRMLFPQTVVMALQKNVILFRVSIIELTANVLLSIVLLQLMGIKGVAYGTVLAFFLEKTVLAVYLWKQKSISPDAYTNFRTWLLYSLLLTGVYCFTL